MGLLSRRLVVADDQQQLSETAKKLVGFWQILTNKPGIW